jgi:hypothetical protein
MAFRRCKGKIANNLDRKPTAVTNKYKAPTSNQKPHRKASCNNGQGKGKGREQTRNKYCCQTLLPSQSACVLITNRSKEAVQPNPWCNSNWADRRKKRKQNSRGYEFEIRKSTYRLGYKPIAPVANMELKVVARKLAYCGSPVAVKNIKEKKQ